MLGDFLRSLRELTTLEPSQVDFAQHVPVSYRTTDWAALAEWGEEEHRALLAEAELTGAQLLGAAERDV